MRFRVTLYCCAGFILATLIASGRARATDDVRLFIGVTHQQFEEDAQKRTGDAQLRAFIKLQSFLENNLLRQLPSNFGDNASLGDVDTWKDGFDEKKLEQLNYTHYLIAEPRTVEYGSSEKSVQVLEIKWYVGAFSPDKDRVFKGTLKEINDSKRAIIIPKLNESDPQKSRYSSSDLKARRAETDGSSEGHWDTADAAETLVAQLKKRMMHLFPELRSKNEYFIQCIEDRTASLKDMNLVLMQSLSETLSAANWSPTTQYFRSRAEAICRDEASYKAAADYRFEAADYLISGSIAWLDRLKKKVRPSIKVRGRIAEMRTEYTFSPQADLASDPIVSLDEFCVSPPKLVEKPAVLMLAEYILAKGLKASGGKALNGGWKCP